jgi:cytochrome c oxidase cbb3-type subunit 4
MDANDLRVVITVTLFIAFLGIVFWAYSSRQKTRFDEAANLPFADDEMQARTISESVSRSAERSGSSAPQAGLEESSNG